MKLLLLTIFALVLAAPAVAAGNPVRPEAHPSCHCKALWDHGSYVYRSVVYVTVDGVRYVLPSVCRVNPRNGNTWCRIVSTP